MTFETIPDVLADRYASPEMTAIWSPRGKIVLEREFWIAVMRAQRDLGVDIPEEAIRAYDRVVDQVDLAGIRARERRTRHDVKARIDEFCALAGYEHIHKGMTSRDVTENVEQTQILRSLRLLCVKHAACLYRLAERAREFRSLVLAGRTHNVPAQMITLGKRLAVFGTEMLRADACLRQFVNDYPLRGIKGPVGTQVDLLTLFGGDRSKLKDFEQRIAEVLGFKSVMGAVGQVYPRSLDFEVVGLLARLAAGPGSFATTLRLMAGQQLASEGFGSGQIGSSAMPHKVNARSCERVHGLQVVLNGCLSMVAALAGSQWNEGDVSCSVVRRVALPGSMFALDGLLETFLTVIVEMEVVESQIAAECERYLPFLATTTILMEAVCRGVGREQAHAVIREHALAVARDVQARHGDARRLVDRLAGDSRLGLSKNEIEACLVAKERLLGTALSQVDEFLAAVERVVDEVPEAVRYVPRPIL